MKKNYDFFEGKMKILLIIFLVCCYTVTAQESNLDRYIQEGLKNNLALKQREFSLRKSMAALDEARGLFMPSIGINARYTRSDGGREIIFPVGDLLNPVYASLNALMGFDAFPTDLQNESIRFMREKEHETKIQLIQPLFKADIFYNYKIQSNLTDIQKAERDLFARTLISDIKTAYYNYLITDNLVKLTNTTDEILKENLRVSESLFNNNKATRDVVYRSQAELSVLEQRKAESMRSRLVSAAYFNFLLNRDQETEILVDSINVSPDKIDVNLNEAISMALGKREELKQLEFAKEAADNKIGLSKAGYLPDLLLAADYGFQGEEYSFTSEDDFWTASLVFRWNLFRGFQDKARVEQSEWEKRQIEARQIDLENRIRLQVREAYQNVLVSEVSITSAKDQLKSAKKTFEIIDRKFREGISRQIEFIDARTTMTNAELNYIVTTFEYYIRLAELERAVAYYPAVDN
jgi:outer membrane protein TolC